MTADAKNRTIGIFDSGIGGLTVLKSIINAIPAEDTIYLGDTARVPYGTKSARTVTQYSLEIGGFLAEMEIKALVVACNTASAVALPALREKFSVPVVGMVEPAVKEAVKVTGNGCIGVIGTEGTIRSGAYETAIKEADDGLSVVSRACPLFVPLAEEGWVDNDIAMLTAERYLGGLRQSGADTVILGCTHYPLFKDTIKKVLGDDVTLVDSGKEAAKELRILLEERGGYSGDSPDSMAPFHFTRKPGTVPFSSRRYFVTDTPDRFLRLGERFLGETIDKVEHVDIS